jgi:uncharacterized protein (UPF0548 family)
VRLLRPSLDEIQAVLGRPGRTFNYPEVGATGDVFAPLPVGLARRYDVDQARFPLGSGDAVFEAARAALFAWRHFEIPWLELFGPKNPAATGQVVATLVRVAGFWFLNPCRVVFTVAGDATAPAAAFGYGTLSGHAELGEERFVVSLNPADGRVWYEIAAFSRPAHWATRLGYPLARRLQRRFREESALALARAVARASNF